MGKAPGISLSLRRAFDGGILAIVGVKSMAAIVDTGGIGMMGLPDGIANHKHRPNSYSGNGHDSPFTPFIVSIILATLLTWQMRHLVRPINQFRLNSFY